ncbi:transglycosylase domain-containing protein [Rhizomicrobium electricum]|uniref:peptidoglycan glycosyltransferase n=1 Tax=Rhizomicrobium electricum TaxID=480070 RepID=A0ABN1EIY0_9PROT|nr:PBP1A family penicillin-binding protein [Rhizomicrobium electricum]NIJ48391.1 penicillin-binding protein 1A [Rhizomicrobium electricum]
MGQIWEGFLRGADAFGGWIIARKNRLLKIAVWVVGIVTIPLLGLFLLPTILAVVAPPLDLKQDLYALNRPVAFTFLDAHGKVVGRRGAAVGDRLTLEEMPAYLPAAFIAMEDRRFYSHHGVDPRGIVRAMMANLRARHTVAGGSTITEQTAKILFTNQERTFTRRIKTEMDAAVLEKSLSKKQILELYLNRIYLGSAAYGVDGAARVYFGKSARELSLGEAAMLATLTRAPSVFSPRRDLAAAQERAGVVLATMVETGAITQAQADEAKAHPAVVVDRASVDARNYYLDAAREEALKLASNNGERQLSGDLIVHTTLEPKLQEAARRTAREVIEGKAAKKANVHEAAIVTMKPDGAVVAMIGGVDYAESTFNRAIQAHRQPGSAFKPFVYLAALESGLSPWETRDDQPVYIDGWAPTNFGGRAYGTITLANAMAHSVNTIAVQVAQEVGVDQVVEAAKRCGIASKLAPNASIALGTSEVTPLELTSAYAVFASGGLKVRPYMVTQVNGADGRILYQRQNREPERVIAEHVMKDLTAMLFGVVSHGTGFSANLYDREAGGKTGTTQDYHDAWFVGFTTDYVTGVWVGNDDSSPMKGVTGGTIPAQMWKSVMKVAEAGLPPKGLDRSPPEDALGLDQSLLSSGTGLSADDEAAINNTPQIDAPQDQRQDKAKRKTTGGFFNWLFGGDEEKPKTAPPPGDN